MNKDLLTLLILQFLIVGCCKDIACFTPPKTFAFELLDKETKENLFSNGTFQEQDIEVIELSDSSNYEFVFEKENNFISIVIGITNITNLSCRVAGNEVFQIYAESKRVSEDCCSFTRYKVIEISKCEYEFNPNSGSYNIFISN